MLYIVGFGPGGYEGMTIEADRVLRSCEIIIGYTTYVNLIRPYFPNKKYVTTAMRSEIERCEMAIEAACHEKNVALICSGDSGVYGMAGLVYELLEKKERTAEVRVIPGVTASVSGGALLGAPLTCDFMTVSLSDLLTPLAVIQKRIRCAAQSDTILCLYNPASKGRGRYLAMACEIVLEYQPETTVCGYVMNINRTGQKMQVLTLGELKELRADMFTTVFIGNSRTRNINGKMVTSRGYQYV